MSLSVWRPANCELREGCQESWLADSGPQQWQQYCSITVRNLGSNRRKFKPPPASDYRCAIPNCLNDAESWRGTVSPELGTLALTSLPGDPELQFLARAPEVGVRRALGASRRWVFVQHLIECEVIGVVGCFVGLVLTIFGLKLLDRVYGSSLNITLDPTMLGVALVLALLSAMIAGIYPAWRICRIQPGLHLKAQ